MNRHIAGFIAALPDDIHTRIKALSDQEPAGILAVTYVHDPAREEGTEVDYYHAAATSGQVPDDLGSRSVPAATGRSSR